MLAKYVYMKEFKGTKSQWVVDGSIYPAINARSSDVCYNIAVTNVSNAPQEERVANAYLIAAAPELLQQCIYAKDELEYLLSEVKKYANGNYRASGTIHKLGEVINKALNIEL